MPVHGTTRWRHAILQKKVINLDHGGAKHVMCAWDTCEKDGYESNKVVVNDAAPGYPPKPITYIFCTERHKQYWLNSVNDCNNLPTGYRSSIL
jgi:hypothetical protein